MLDFEKDTHSTLHEKHLTHDFDFQPRNQRSAGNKPDKTSHRNARVARHNGFGGRLATKVVHTTQRHDNGDEVGNLGRDFMSCTIHPREAIREAIDLQITPGTSSKAKTTRPRSEAGNQLFTQRCKTHCHTFLLHPKPFNIMQDPPATQHFYSKAILQVSSHIWDCNIAMIFLSSGQTWGFIKFSKQILAICSAHVSSAFHNCRNYGAAPAVPRTKYFCSPLAAVTRIRT